MKWYQKYLSIYGKALSDIPDGTILQIRNQLQSLQSDDPEVSVVVIAHNEGQRLLACLWSLSELQSQWRLEIMGVNNQSDDNTEELFRLTGLPYHNEERKSPGFARQCGLVHSRGRYHFFIDADTMYPPYYIDFLMEKLSAPAKNGQPETVAVGSLWSYYPDANHSAWGLHLFEFIRDCFLFVQHFKRPELCIRGMVFAFRADYARKEQIRTDIRRGEDGSLALSLKKYGRIQFVYNRQARPVTGYGTLGNESLFKSLLYRIRYQLRGISRIFFKTNHYEDRDDNLINPRTQT